MISLMDSLQASKHPEKSTRSPVKAFRQNIEGALQRISSISEHPETSGHLEGGFDQVHIELDTAPSPSKIYPPTCSMFLRSTRLSWLLQSVQKPNLHVSTHPADCLFHRKASTRTATRLGCHVPKIVASIEAKSKLSTPTHLGSSITLLHITKTLRHLLKETIGSTGSVQHFFQGLGKVEAR